MTRATYGSRARRSAGYYQTRSNGIGVFGEDGPRIKLVKIHSRHPEHADVFAGRVRAELDYDAQVYTTAKEAADADIIATVTPARSPVLMAE